MREVLVLVYDDIFFNVVHREGDNVMTMNVDFLKTQGKSRALRCVAYIQERYARIRRFYQSRQNTALQDVGVFLRITSERILVRREYTTYDLAAFFIMAVIIGGGIKAVAVTTITMGFEDYKLASEETAYDLNVLEQRYRDTNGEATDKGIEPLRACTP